MKYASWMVIGALLLLAVFRDLIANGRPLYCQIDNKAYYPGLRILWAAPERAYGIPVLDSIKQYHLWKKFPYDQGKVWFAPIPFSPGETLDSPAMAAAAPGSLHTGHHERFVHWLGTTDGGHDVAAGIVAGARVAVTTGLTAMSIALAIGLFLGAIAGFYGDRNLRVRALPFWSGIFGIMAGFWYAFGIRYAVIQNAEDPFEAISVHFLIWLLIFGVCRIIGGVLHQIAWLRRFAIIPVDMAIMRIAEVFNAIPKLVLLAVVAAMMQYKQSLFFTVALIGLFSWTGVAKFVRAELLRIRELDYITAARALGLSSFRILWRHALPNAVQPAIVACTFGIAGAILLEASLAFLGISDPSLSGASWGSLLHASQGHFNHWWVSVPAGLAICITVLALNDLGEKMMQKNG